ncbi:MAG: Fic family protein [Candidatus Gracilibacteria bacterium]|nr:Fic family protein [Candidatus Gracilibacteria bacterium]
MEIQESRKLELLNSYGGFDHIVENYSNTVFFEINDELEKKYKFFKEKFIFLKSLEIPKNIDIGGQNLEFSESEYKIIASKIEILEEKKFKILSKMKEYDYMIEKFEPLLKGDYGDLGNRFGSIEQLSSIKLEGLFAGEFDLGNILQVKQKNPGYFKSYSFAVEDLLNTSIPINKSDLLRIHSKLLTNPKNNKTFAEQGDVGKIVDFQTFRITKETGNDEKDKANITFVGPKKEDIANLLDDYLEFYNNNYQRIHPIIFASILMIQMSIIHPFGDGNSRMSRLVAGWSLRKMDYSQVPIISYIFSKNKNKHEKKLREIRLDIINKISINTKAGSDERFEFIGNEKNVYYSIDYNNWINYFIESYTDGLDFIYNSIIKFIFNLRSKDFINSNFGNDTKYKHINSEQIQEIYNRIIENFVETGEIIEPKGYIHKLKRNSNEENQQKIDNIIEEIKKHFISLIIKYA